MRRFVIYLIKEEFCLHFFGNEAKLYDLFYQYEYKQDQEVDPIIARQVHYIRRKIPVHDIQRDIEGQLKRYNNSHVLLHSFYLEDNRSRASLSLHNHSLLLRSAGTYEAETTFFEMLRKFDPYFLAIDYHNEKYGWLNPVKQRKFV